MKKSLTSLQFSPLKLGEVKPLGWLKNQLQTQIDGLSGHLDEFWPDIMNSGWIGGNAEGWERFPYWLDGVVPLAYLLESNTVIQKLENYMDYILDHQQEDGWFGPTRWGRERLFDPWPNMIFCKVLIQYYELTQKESIIQALLKYYYRLNEILDEYTLGDSWVKFRWMDGVWGIHWLIDYLDTDSEEIEFLLTLAEKMWKQGYDWKSHFDDFFYIHFKKYKRLQLIYSMHTDFPEEMEQIELGNKYRRLDLRSHVVNNAMGIKSSTIWSRQSGLDSDIKAIFKAIHTLDKYHGQATGMFSGDEHLAGKSPSQGTELCSVVEYLFSLETTIPIIGYSQKCVKLIDRMEKICFNALPATFLPDMWSHQYDQQVNQVQAKRVKRPIYTSNGRDSNTFGLEPNFGCCTANMHQGWPKFTKYGLWARDEEGLLCLAYSPCKISTKISTGEKYIPIEIEELTNYPFTNEIEFALHLENSGSFSLKFRIPAWCSGSTIRINQESPIECETGNFHKITRQWNDGDKIVLVLPMELKQERRFNNSVILTRGPLIFSFNPKERKEELKRRSKAQLLKLNNSLDVPPQVKDWEIYPKSNWQYALVEPIEAICSEIPENIKNMKCFDNQNPPVKLTVNAIEIKNWGLECEAASPPPRNPIVKTGKIEVIKLIPYGCTNLRITEFPTLNYP
jgi:hypothetical protein